VRTATVNDELHPDIIDFLDLLAEHFGTRRDALVVFFRSSPDFREWRKRVRYCQKCQQHVPRAKGGGYDYHRTPNPHEPPPYSIQCPGSYQPVNQGPRRAVPTRQLNQWLARIRHQVKQVQPDLL